MTVDAPVLSRITPRLLAQLTPRRFALVFGTGLLALGVVGFAATGLGDAFVDHDVTVLGFGVNPASNLLHLLSGTALLGAGTGEHETARHAAMLTTSAYLLLGVLGLALHGAQTNPLGVTGSTVGLHFTTGLLAALAARPGGDHRSKPV